MRLLIVDALAHSRDSLKTYLQLQAGIEVVGEAAAATPALQLVPTLQPDLIIMDVNLPDMNGFAATRQLMTLPQPPAVILLTVHHQVQDILQAQEAGAAACIEKSAGVDRILKAIFTLNRNFQEDF